MVEKMWKGLNLGNTLEAGQEGWWQAPAQEFYFDDYVAQGFTSVRIPVRWDRHTGTTAPYTVDPAWLSRVEEVVDWALSRDLVVVLNAHHEHWLLDDFTPDNISRFEAIWTQVATHFQGKSENLLFEVINEPYFKLSAGQVDDLNHRILNIIRADNPTRIVLLTGGGKNSWQAPLQMTLPADDYLIAYFHYYVPFNFTSGQINNWGTAAEKSTMLNHFQQVKAWADAQNIPVYLGEFGADDTVDPDNRADYYHTLVNYATSLGFAWAAWEPGTAAKGFYFREPGSWNPSILDALQIDEDPEPPTVQNLITNPCFDTNVSGWNLVCGGGSKAALSDGADGGCACEDGSDTKYLRFLADTRGNCIRNPNLNYQGPGEYELCFQARTIQYGNSLKARMIINGAEFIDSDDFVLQTGGEWDTYTYTFAATTDCSNCTFHFQFVANDDGGHYRIDDVSLVKLSDREPPVFQQCPENTALPVGADCASVLPDYTGLAVVSDNAGVASISQEPEAGTALPIGIHAITLTATDINGNTASCTFDLTVVDTEAPGISVMEGIPVDPVVLGTAIAASAQFTDDCSVEALWYWGDGASTPGSINDGTISGGHTYANPGVYSVSLTVSDASGNTSTLVAGHYLVVYDPSAGFVTGGGWIDSPAGALAAAPALTGRANFGFVAKYQRGSTVPSGHTSFQFQAGNFQFASTDYEWMTVAGEKVKFKGSGRVNESGDYRFIVTAIDGDLQGSSGPDKFRIRIWEAAGGGVIYDNKMGAADTDYDSQEIGGGQIRIYDGEQGQTMVSTIGNSADFTTPGVSPPKIFPNPFRDQLSITFELVKPEPVILQIFDLRGQLVREMLRAGLSAGTHRISWDGRDGNLRDLPPGTYLIRLRSNGHLQTWKATKF